MKKPKPVYWMKTSCRVLNEEQIGAIQHLIHDTGQSVKSLAKKYGVSIHTIYKVKWMVPANLVKIDANYSRLFKLKEANKLHLPKGKRKAS